MGVIRSITRRIKAVASTIVRGIRAAGRALGWSSYLGSDQRFRNEREVLELLGSNARLGSPVDAIATDVAMVPWVLKRRVKKKNKSGYMWEEIGRLGEGINLPGEESHPLIDRLNQPTPRLTWSAWIYVLTVYRLACGYAPIWTEELDGDIPGVLTPVAPHCVPEGRPRKLGDGSFGFQVLVNGVPENVPIDHLLWAFRIDPKDPRGPGLGKARGCEDEVAADEAMVKFNAHYFKNGTVLGPIINIPGADLDAVEKEWKQERMGVINAHRPLLTNSDQAVQVANTAPTMRDLAYPEGRKLGRDFILQAFHVSQVRVGILENSTRSVIDGSDFHQQKHCTLPELVYWREFFNRHLVKRWGDDLYLDFVNPVKETAEARRQLADTGIRGGWITVNEARDLHELPEIPGGDLLLIPVNNVIMLDVSHGIKVPDIQTQLRMNGGQNGGGGSKPDVVPPVAPSKEAQELFMSAFEAQLNGMNGRPLNGVNGGSQS